MCFFFFLRKSNSYSITHSVSFYNIWFFLSPQALFLDWTIPSDRHQAGQTSRGHCPRGRVLMLMQSGNSSLHTIGLLCCFLPASFQLTSLIGYRMRGLYLIWQIKCYLSLLFSCTILYTLSICKWLEEERWEKNNQMSKWKEATKKNTVLGERERRKTGQPP